MIYLQSQALLSIMKANNHRQAAVNFAINNNSSSTDNAITIHLRSGTYYPQLSIKGLTTITSPPHVTNTKTTNNTVTNIITNNNSHRTQRS